MLLRKWKKLPSQMQCEEVRKYYDALKHRVFSLIIKRFCDIVFSFILIILFLPLMLLLMIMIKIDSRGPVFYKQARVTSYLKMFHILKFRTMVVGADKKGPLVTTENDHRITRVGKFLRKFRLDEIPQLFNVLSGNMTFVGTRPEVLFYVNQYTNEMLATLLLPAGITSLVSIKYKEESKLLSNSEDADDCYVKEILPNKMKYNLEYLMKFNIFKDAFVLIYTVFAVIF